MGTKNIHILVGLPGSGKTTWATEMVDHNYKDRIYNCDAYIKNKQYTNKNIREALVNDENYADNVLYHYGDNNVYVDGLFLTQSAVETVIDSTLEMISHRRDQRPEAINFIIEQWDCNREACMSNDNKRIEQGDRAINAQVTIKYVPFEEIDIKDLELHIGITLNSYPNLQNIKITFSKNDHKVVQYSIDETFIYVNSPHHDGKLYSESWSEGGHWGDCWGNEGTISGEAPKEFDELDNLLEKICPNISFLQYKKLVAECVTLDEYGESGYYGTYEHRARYICDLNSLYNWLKNHNLINEQ